ncbi:MAG TPA: PilZ domain-containing protein [Geobacteraceae bacterium]
MDATKKILLVSSSPSFLERNLNLLKRTDFGLYTATSGEEANSLAREEVVDLIISDFHLNDMAGDALCSLVLTEHRKDPVAVVLVCHDNPTELDRAGRSGANACITRPVQPLQLLETAGRLLTVEMVRSKRVSLKVRVESRKEALEFYGSSHDISLTGLLLEAGERLVIGDRITCRFVLIGPRPMEVEGEVVRSVRALDGEHRYGIRFIKLAPEYRAEIAEYVATADPET